MFNKNIMQNINNLEFNKIKYASQVIPINYITDFIKTVDRKKIFYLNNLVDRSNAISKFSELLKNIEIALKIEAGIFEFTIVYCCNNNFTNKIMLSVYNDKINDLFQNLNHNNIIGNTELIKLIKKNHINPQEIAFMKPHELFPQRWKLIVDKISLREEKKKNIATTDLYQCWKCKQRKTRVYEIQQACCDEPATKYIHCLNCYNVMKK